MLLPPWKIPPIEPCDPITLDAIADLSDDQLAALAGAIPDEPPDDRATAPVATQARFGSSVWRHHTPTPSTPALHLPAYP